MALAACSQGDGNSSANSNAVEHAANRCVPPALALADGSQLGSAMLSETKANFASAYKSACAKDMFKAGPLIERGAADQGQLFLINASEANVASIYLSDVDGNRMVLEYPFLTIDGRSQVPSADQLEEAIYCAVVGATPEEQESTGRCLVD
jgi:hypothetical protein